MARTISTMLELGTRAPNFRLPDYKGTPITLSDYKEAKAYLIAFICNHCPYVKSIIKGFVQLVKEYQEKDVVVIAINANDFATYPDDRPEKMEKMAERLGFTFPYLYDESQEVAKAYKAACTPDFYLFDADRKLVYRGQMDDSRPGNRIPVSGSALRRALDALLEGKEIFQDQRPSVGSDIKWRKSNKPSYL